MKIFEYCFGCSPDVFPDVVVITPFVPVKSFEKHCNVLTRFKGRLYSGVIAEIEDTQFAVLCCGLGDRLIGDAILYLRRTAVRSIIFTGSCGGLSAANVGDLLLCSSAFNGEGFTKYYDRDHAVKDILKTGKLILADKGYTDKFEKFIQNNILENIMVKRGKVFTIGSIAAETEENVKVITEHGFEGIEMELSAVYSAARFSGIKATGIIYVSDLPGKKGIEDVFTSEEKEKYAKGKDEMIRLSVEFLSNED
ncbi:MAG: hypothetical protein KAI70_05770 [Candidatus Omnitrophica bacterium]|nr:hypothetical protein [Candidatus Omnitrophota bacterium]